MATTSHLRQSAAMVSSSSRVNTLPVGLFGVFRMIAFVLSLNAAGELLGIERPVGPARDARRLVQRDEARRGAGEDRIRSVVLVERLEDDDFVARDR